MRSRHPETQRKKFKRDGGSWLGRDFVETTVEFKHGLRGLSFTPSASIFPGEAFATRAARPDAADPEPVRRNMELRPGETTVGNAGRGGCEGFEVSRRSSRDGRIDPWRSRQRGSLTEGAGCRESEARHLAARSDAHSGAERRFVSHFAYAPRQCQEP